MIRWTPVLVIIVAVVIANAGVGGAVAQSPTYITSFTPDDDLNAKVTNVDAAKFQAYFAHKNRATMNPIASSIVDAGNEHNMNSIFLMAVAAWEGGWGTSSYVATRHNWFGYGALRSNPDNAWEFSSDAECVDVVARKIKAGYLLNSGTYSVLVPTSTIDDHPAYPYVIQSVDTGAYYNGPTVRGWIVKWNLNSQTEMDGIVSIMNDFTSWHTQTYGEGIRIGQTSEPGLSDFRYPLDVAWDVTRDFKWVDGRGYHLGEDVMVNEYTPVYAASSGIVKYTSTDIQGYGSVIIIEHPSSHVTTLYGHLSKSKELKVASGQSVARGQLIGYIGNDAENGEGGPHLHFGIRKGLYSTDTFCGKWPYVGYSVSCTGNTHEQYRDMWHDPSDFIRSRSTNKWEFNTPGDNEGWLPHNIEAWSVQTDGRFIINPGPTDPLIEQPYISLDATFYNAVNINMASNAPDGVGAIYFTTSDSKEFSEDKKVDFDVNNDGDWHDYSIFMGSQPMWTGTITGIRIDPADYGREEGAVDSVGFDHIRVEHSHIILDRSIYPNVAPAGDELTFVFNIENQFSNEISKVRLGARIRSHEPQGGWIDDMPNDKVITLKPGANDYSRAFKTSDGLSDGLYDVEWVVMDEGTKRWIDHEDMCPILTISTSPAPNPTPTYAPTAMPTATGTVSPTPDITPPGDIDVIKMVTSVVEETIRKIFDLLEKLL